MPCGAATRRRRTPCSPRRLRSSIVHRSAHCVQVADAARNNNAAAVKAMLARGFPVTARFQHGAMPLHWAAFHGNPEMLRGVLERDPPLKACDLEFNGTAMGWLIQGALGDWRGIVHRPHDDCARLLLDAGAHVDETALPTGNDALDAVLRERFVSE